MFFIVQNYSQMRTITFLTIVFCSLTGVAIAGTLTRIEALTDSILLLHFTDGTVVYPEFIGATGNDDVQVDAPISLQLAETPSGYQLTSLSDVNYQSGLSPLIIGRKSKPWRFASNWPPQNPVMQHFIYLKLPHGLQRGANYTLQLPSGLVSQVSMSFTFDEFVGQSSAIHVNTVAYESDATLKFGYVYGWNGTLSALDLDGYTGNAFHLVDSATGSTVFSGTLALRSRLNLVDESYNWTTSDSLEYYGADVWECDFSSFQQAGTYRLVVEGIGCSYPFKVKGSAYGDAFYTTCRGLYHQRSGPAAGPPYTSYVKPIDHYPGVGGFQVLYSTYRFMDGQNAFDSLPFYSTNQPVANAWGGWMDAADFDRQSAHMIVSAFLAHAFELAPENFSDNQLNIPESGNGLPDILDEAYWGIDLFRRIKGPTGGTCGGLEATDHPEAGATSWTDSLQWYAYGEEPESSYRFAGCLAQLGWCFSMAGRPDSNSIFISEANAAWAWANTHLNAADSILCVSDRLFADAMLFKLTGDTIYLNDFRSIANADFISANRIDESDEWEQLAVAAFLTTNRGNTDTALYNDAYRLYGDLASFFLQPAQARSCRFGGNYWMPTVVGATVSTPQVIPLITWYEISGQTTGLPYAYTSADYCLGANPENITWVTGLGDNAPTQIANLDSWYDGIPDDVKPGLVPYAIKTPYFDYNFSGCWGVAFSQSFLYPNDRFTWPLHELYIPNRYSWETSEYTVTQTIGPAAATYGYLINPNSPPIGNGYSPNVVTTSNFQEATAMPSRLMVFPNPADDYVLLLADNFLLTQVRIVDLTGAEIYSSRSVVQNQLRIDTDSFAPGIYIVQVSDGKTMMQRKLVLAR